LKQGDDLKRFAFEAAKKQPLIWYAITLIIITENLIHNRQSFLLFTPKAPKIKLFPQNSDPVLYFLDAWP